MLKRGWLEAADPDHQLLDQARQLLSQHAPMRSVGAALLLAVVEEFATSSRSANVGMSWEFHLACKRTFEAQTLKNIFVLALQNLQVAPRCPRACHPHEVFSFFLSFFPWFCSADQQRRRG